VLGVAPTDIDLHWLEAGQLRELAREHCRLTGEPVPQTLNARTPAKKWFVELLDDGATVEEIRDTWRQVVARGRKKVAVSALQEVT